MAEKKPFILSDGTEVKFDFSKVTRKEFRAMFSVNQSDEEGDAIVTKITGVAREALDNLNQLDWARIVQEILRLGNRPDPI
jgi:hypothetical protein